MKRVRGVLVGLGVLAGLVGYAAAPVYAEEDGGEPVPTAETSAPAIEASSPSIKLKPTNEYIMLKADTPVDNELVVANDGKAAYDFKLYAQPYTVDDSDDGYNFAFNTMNSHSSIYEWVSFQKPDGSFANTATYHIEPGQELTIVYKVTPPSSVPAGSQYTAIFAETINDEAGGDLNGLYTVSRVALLLYGRSNEGAIIGSEISDYSVKSFMTSGKIVASSRVKSIGNMDVTATYKMIVSGIFGNVLYTNTWSYPVLPDTTRYVAMSWDETPAFGLFSVQYSVTTLDKIEDHTTMVLILPIWMIISFILLLTIITIWIIIVLKKRKERKSRLIV